MRVLTAAGIFSLALTAQPNLPPKAKEYVEQMGRGEGSLKAGDLAPDFQLRKSKSEQTVRLSSFRGKRPVALLFGSYT
jgi:hypothetical protein